MKNQELLQKLQQSDGYFVNTHVEMTGLDHSDTYLNKDLLLSDPNSLQAIAEAVIRVMCKDIEVVCGPPMGGLLLAEAVALAGLENKKYLKLALTKKNNSQIDLKRGHAKSIKDKQVLIVDDVVKTGQTLQRTIKAVENACGVVRQVVVLANWRGRDLVSKYNPVELLPRPDIYRTNQCKLCANNLAIEFPKN